MIIHRATHDDFEKVLATAHRFFSAARYGDIVEFDDGTFRRTFEHLMGDDGVCLIAELNGSVIAGAGAIAYPFYFNASHKTGQELFWWVDEEMRGTNLGMRLFKALEDWARSVGCKTFTMIALDALNPEMVGSIYKRCGYRASEHTYIKEL